MKQALHIVRTHWGIGHALQWIVNIMVAVHVALGVAVLAGGPQRFVDQTYQPLVNLTDGQTWIWGVWVLVAAFFMTIPNRYMQVVGLWIGMVWHIMWCALFAVSVIEYPTAGATAAVAYGGFAMLDAALLTARIVEHDGD